MKKNKKNKKNTFSPTVKLSNINIGQTAGENEAKNPYFENLFYTGNKKYSEICKHNKFIIRGRKGTGKTILAHYIKKKAYDNNICSCKINSLNDIELQKLLNNPNRNLLDEENKVFWRYCILIELGKCILEKHPYQKYINFSLKKLRRIINRRNNPYLKIVEVNKSYNLSKKSSFSLNSDVKKSIKTSIRDLSNSDKFGLGLSKEKNTGLIEKYEISDYFAEINDLEKLVLKILSKEKQGYMIIYDDLDEIGDNIDNHKNYKSLILGMIFAVQDLNNKIQIKNKDSKIIISIRSDILDSLNKHSSNLRKIISDNSVNLYWLNKANSHYTDNELIDLILTKITASVPEYKSIDKKILFENLFPKNISKTSIVKYLLDKSMGRPRQIIEFLNIIIENYGDCLKFEPKHFRNCLKYFSIELYKDLENEFSVYENKNELNESLKLIKSLRKADFEFGEILAHYNANRNQYKYIKTVEDSLKLMYSFGVIGMYEKNDDDDIPKYSWGYREDAEQDIDIRQIFLVHSALRPVFNLTQRDTKN